MAVTATSREAAASLMGFESDADGTPYRRDIAGAVRKIVRSRGAVPKDSVIAWVLDICRSLGHDFARVRPEVDAVISVMTLAGDIVSLTCGGEEALAPKPARKVAVSFSMAAVLGGADSESESVGTNLDAVIRLVPLDDETVRLADELGPPSFRAALAAMGLPHGRSVTLREFVGLVFHELVRNGEEIAPEEAEVLGSLSGDGSWAFGQTGAGGPQRPLALRVLGDDTIIALPLPDLEALGWLALSGMEIAGTNFSWTAKGIAPPRQLSIALAITGRRNGDLSWTLPVGADAEISEWLGADVIELPDGQAEGDPAQRAVIASPTSSLAVVEAGPGSGKTWVACRRTARIAEAGVPPSRIVVVSFTKAAVNELRGRVASFLPDPSAAAELSVWTLDSLAWRLRSGFSGDEDGVPIVGYEANVLETTKMLTETGSGLADFVAGIQHLILDEAQDLVSPRRELVLALFAALSPECGVTVFMDSAQAIYGWQDRASRGGNIKSELLKRGFAEHRLDIDHRTRTPKLRAMFAKCRKVLLGDTGDPKATYQNIRQIIESHAEKILPDIHESVAGGSTLMLFRGRAGLLSAASKLWSVGTDFRLRLSGRRPAAAAWVAALLSLTDGKTIAKSSFDTLWDEFWPPPPGIDRDTAWKLLRRVASTGTATVDLAKLRSRLSASVPPAELSVKDNVGKRLILSTIHGAKGQEADHVRLMMPRVPPGERDWGEEARILFVGATRARKTLYVGSTESRLSNQAGIKRLWQLSKFRTSPNARVEIGAEGDIDEIAQVSSASWPNENDAVSSQARLWSLAERTVRLVAERVSGSNAYALIEEDGDGMALGFLSRSVVQDFWSIGKEIDGSGTSPAKRIGGINLIGVRTVAVSAPLEELLEPYRHSGIWLVPVVAGVATVFFNARDKGNA
jgi:hypothetical protein